MIMKLVSKTSKPDSIRPWIDVDLSAAAKANRLAPAFGVDEVIDELLELAGNGVRPIIVGESGVGKTAAVHELVRRIYRGERPELFGTRRILQVSITRGAASLRNRYDAGAEFEKFVRALLEREGKFALFICDLQAAYEYDLETQVAFLSHSFDGPILAEGRPAAIESMLELNETLAERYTVVRMEEPSLPKARAILTAWAVHQRAAGFEYTGSSIEQALTLSHRFLARTRLPRKAIDLLRQAARQGESPVVTSARVIDRFCAFHRTPRVLADPAMPLDLEDLKAQFEAKVVGQSEAVDAVVQTIGVVKAGLSDLRRPLGVFLFAGPTGVGKTHIAQLLAEYLFGDRERLVRLNMADFPDESGPSHLFGDSRQHEPPLRRGLLTHRLMGRPFGVLLLDEFEKAHAKVHDQFLQLIDEGSFINGMGETISCRATIIIATTNCGSEVYRGEVFGFAESGAAALERAVTAALERQFRFELLNRFDRIIQFRPLSRAHVRTIAARTIARLPERNGMSQRRMTLKVDPVVIDYVVEKGFDEQRGARALNRTIEREVTSAVALVLAGNRLPLGTCIQVGVADGGLIARAIGPIRADDSIRPVRSAKTSQPVTCS